VSGFFNSKRLLAMTLAVSTACGATFLFAQTGGSLPGPVPTGPTTMPAADKPIATINGKDINNARFYSLMMEVAGMRVFQQVFELTLVQRACSDAGVPLSGPDFENRMKDEFQRTLDGISGANVKDSDKPRILDEILRQRGVTPIEFRMNLEKNAGLRALAQGKVSVSNEDVQDAYDAKYGERAEVVIFDLGAADSAAVGANLRKAIEVDKKTGAEAAQAAGIPAPSTATISKSAHGNGIEAIASTIFTTNRKEGELTASIPFNGKNLMIQVVKKHPDTRATNPKAAVEAQLRKDVQALKETNWMNAHMAKLRNEANVQINDPVLSSQFEAILAAIRAQNTAASQPATTGPAPIAPAPAAPAAPGRTGR
jgi:hypothetical protein